MESHSKSIQQTALPVSGTARALSS